MLKKLEKLNDGVARVEGFFLCFFLAAMVLLAFLQVVMRNFFNSGIPWADSVVRTLVLWVGFLGAVQATKLDQLLTVEVLTKFMPERMRHAVSIIVKLFAGVVCIYLFEASLRFIGDERGTGEKFIHLFPFWWTFIIIPFTFIMIPFHFLFSIINDFRYLVKGKA
jgi:TRAP-type C4-dicarboxylate transport system permease small subunit